MSDTFDMAALQGELTLDEGRSNKIYVDTVGKVTGGIGHNLTANGLSDAAVNLIFGEDVAIAVAALDRNISWWRQLPAPQQRVMINLCFNMGWATLATFTDFLSYMRGHEFDAAASDLANTKWFGEVSLRGPRMQDRLRGITRVS